jgi:hypothetical protein
MAIPVLFERKIGNQFRLSAGSYFGRLLAGKEENKNKFSNNKWLDVTDNTNYRESQKFTCDFYFDLKYAAGEEYFPIIVGPFFKYKLTDNWMEQRRKKFSFGLNFGFYFQFP